MRKTKSSPKPSARARAGLKRARELRIGISGWNYEPWRGVFYPPKHPQKRELADTAGKWPYAEEITTDLVYLRLHGDTELYVSGYSDPALASWAERIRRWRRGRHIFVYFDNDAKVHAPFDAQRLRGLLAS